MREVIYIYNTALNKGLHTPSNKNYVSNPQYVSESISKDKRYVRANLKCSYDIRPVSKFPTDYNVFMNVALSSRENWDLIFEHMIRRADELEVSEV